MAWSVEFNDTAKRQLRKMDRQWQGKILNHLEDEILPLDDPTSRGKALTGAKQGLWRYRIGDYRVICTIEDQTLLIMIVEDGHRREIYR